MDDYSIIDSHAIFDHTWVKIVQDTLDHRGIVRSYYYMISPVDAVATIGVTSEGELILTRQYRHPVGQVIYDLPAGRLEPGENPLEGARREFEEETGYLPSRIENIGSYNQFPGSMRAFTHLFFASDLISTRQHLDDGEELEVVYKPVAEMLDMVLRGEIIDGSLQIGLLLALQKGLISI